ncbi:MAG: hypothetical protein DHS20C13_15580 [Thermodesulfobacteriota bacterium]|nr:MAG: hypothetical protein DHS20C13_15580 [Thermodesulfobacteriota bacterium]
MTRDNRVTDSHMILSILFLVLIVGSCSSNKDLKQDLTTYCVRDCVMETSDAELCDTACKCAASGLSENLSKEELLNLVQSINEANGDNQDSISKLSNALKVCMDTGE